MKFQNLFKFYKFNLKKTTYLIIGLFLVVRFIISPLYISENEKRVSYAEALKYYQQELKPSKKSDVKLINQRMKDYKARLKTDPDNYKLLEDLGYAYAELNNEDKAITYLAKSVRISNKSETQNNDIYATQLAYQRLSYFFRSKNKPQLAFDYLNKSGKLDNLSLAEIYFISGNIDEAIKYYQKFNFEMSGVAFTEFKLGICYNLKKDYQKARKHYKSAVNYGDDPLYSRMANIFD